MTEAAARREARALNEIREPGDPIYVPYRLEQPDGKVWDVGPVEIRLAPVIPPRSFEGMF